MGAADVAIPVAAPAEIRGIVGDRGGCRERPSNLSRSTRRSTQQHRELAGLIPLGPWRAPFTQESAISPVGKAVYCGFRFRLPAGSVSFRRARSGPKRKSPEVLGALSGSVSAFAPLF
jgi:hypothetical protein